MKIIFILITTFLIESDQMKIIYEFSDKSEMNDWRIINDGVMGGISSSSINLDESGNAVFQGRVRLEYNGGFASVRHRLNLTDVKSYTHIALTIKGDNKRYQFRIKNGRYDYHSYVSYFKSKNQWQRILIPIEDMVPMFRGRVLSKSNFNYDKISEVSILIGNYRQESFKLQIDKIELVSR